MCSLSYPASKAHAPYYIVICGLFGFTMLFHVSSQTAGFSEDKVIGHKMWIFSTTFIQTFPTLRSIQPCITKMCIDLLVKCTLFLSDFNKTWVFSKDFRNNLKYQISSKSVRWELSYSMRTDKRKERDMTKLVFAFLNFANSASINTDLDYE